MQEKRKRIIIKKNNNNTEERVSLGEGDEGRTNKSNKAPPLHPHKYFATYRYVRLDWEGKPFFFVSLCIGKSKVGSRPTWEGCRAEPCGNRPPPHACAAWRAASATRTSCFSAAAPPVGGDKKKKIKKNQGVKHHED